MALASNSKSVLADNLSDLLARRQDMSRLDLSRQMGVADGTLGRIKYGTGNPTVEVLDQIASFFKVPTWELLAPPDAKGPAHSAGLDVGLLSWAVTTALGAFRRAKVMPTDEGIAAAVGFVYAHAIAGKDLKEIGPLVDKELKRLSQGAIA